MTADTAPTWRRCFLAEQLDGLADDPRPSWPPTISVDQVQAVVVTTLEEIPKNATNRSRNSMAEHGVTSVVDSLLGGQHSSIPFGAAADSTSTNHTGARSGDAGCGGDGGSASSSNTATLGNTGDSGDSGSTCGNRAGGITTAGGAMGGSR